MTVGMNRLLVPAISTVVMLLVLVGLGIWQMERLAWKTGLLAAIDHAERAPAVPLGEGDPPAFAKLVATGVFRPGLTGLYGAEVRDTPTGPALGGQLLAVLDRAAGLPLLVDLGWVQTPAPLPAGTVRVEGYARPGDRPGLFAARDDLAKRQFYTLDPAAIGAALGVGQVAPFVLVAMGPPAVPDPARALPRPPNNHLSYAITWFGLAAALVVIFALYLRREWARQAGSGA